MNKFALNYNLISPFGGLKGAYPSDGFMPQYTQELDVVAGNKYRVQGANHLEVGDMTTDGNGIDETAVEFCKIF